MHIQEERRSKRQRGGRLVVVNEDTTMTDTSMVSSARRPLSSSRRLAIHLPSAMSIPFLAIMLLLLLLLLPQNCHSIPMVIVDSGRAKCFSVEAPMDTVLEIQYTAPDAPLDKTDPEYSPTFIALTVDPADRVTDTKLHPSPVRNRLHPQNVVVEKPEGKFKHTMEVDGNAQICIRASAASSAKPMRFGLRVVEEDDYSDLLMDQKDEAGKEENKAKVSAHLSHMEMEIRRIQSGMVRILGEADFAKERDSMFHRQTQSMHSATIFWPIVQVCVLIMTGFTQASHIVRFFQSRRII